MKLFILSELVKNNTNPYELYRILKGNLLSKFVSITEGQFYYNVDSLVKKEFIKKSKIVKTENRPDKKIYAITENGISFFEKSIYSSFENANQVDDLFMTIFLVRHVDKEKIIRIFDERLKELRADLKKLEIKLNENDLEDNQMTSYLLRKRRFNLTELEKIYENLIL
jgi:DNA-binding PadR family transcriptional regulator